MTHTFLAPAKLNLFLHVTGRRADGYHLLESVFELLDLGDSITLNVRPGGGVVRLTDVAGVPADTDLMVRAARLLQHQHQVAQGVEIAIEKRIPMGGGLGGGSSDAATVLLALNRLWGLALTRAELMALGMQLGADVPFFLFGRTAFAEGIGEQLTPVTLPPLWFVVLKPQTSVPTAEIFGSPNLTRNAKSVKIADFSAGGFSTGPGSAQSGLARDDGAGVIRADSSGKWFAEPTFRNDLQAVAVSKYPEVGAALSWLQQMAGEARISARMTGSGACVFAAYGRRDAAEEVLAQCPPEWAGFVAGSLGRHPLMDLAA